MGKRTQQAALPVTPDEGKAIRDYADSKGQSVAGLLREVVFPLVGLEIPNVRPGRPPTRSERLDEDGG